MQLLDSEQLEVAFQLHGINHDVHARRFYADVWALIQRAEKARDAASLSSCETELRHLCQKYFSIMNAWRVEEEERHEGEPACAGSRSNAAEALAMLPAFERQFFRYALCYMELNRALIHMRVQLSHFARETNIDSADILEVNHGTGALLARAHKERLDIMEKRLRMERVKSLLQHFDPLMENIGADLPRLLGQERGDHQLTLFKGALRKEEFQRARAVIKNWKDPRLVGPAMKIILMAERDTQELRAGDGLMLHSGELSLIMAFLKSDEVRANQFLEKFDVPYMIFQYRILLHQGYLLGRIGSIEGLIIQHAKLLSLSARPHNDPDHAQTQEQAILVPARALVQGRFKTLGAIFDDMETTITLLEKLFARTKGYIAQTPAQ